MNLCDIMPDVRSLDQPELRPKSHNWPGDLQSRRVCYFVRSFSRAIEVLPLGVEFFQGGGYEREIFCENPSSSILEAANSWFHRNRTCQDHSQAHLRACDVGLGKFYVLRLSTTSLTCKR